jgi:hypothetical protein
MCSEFESEYTLTGYRREQNSYAGCAWSIIGCKFPQLLLPPPPSSSLLI